MVTVKEYMKRLDKISEHNMEFDGRADYRKGLRTERERILKIISEMNTYNAIKEDDCILIKDLSDAILGANE